MKTVLFTAYVAIDSYIRKEGGTNTRARDIIAAEMLRYGFPGFTLIETRGYWEGKSELAFKIETVAGSGKQAAFSRVCAALALRFGEAYVLYTTAELIDTLMVSANNTVEELEL